MSRLVSLRLALSAALLSLGMLTVGGLTPAVDSASAQAVGPGRSGLPIPRFVSLKSSRVNLRIGPGRTYPVDWMYMKAGLPVEVIQEYDNWRRVRDSEGAEGWINQSLLSGKRTGIATPWNIGKEATVSLLREPSADSRLVATIEPGVLGQIERCDGKWCDMRFGNLRGYVSQALIWGAYPDEQITD